jgi:hypothetical protein
MQPVLKHRQRDRRDLQHLMAYGIRIISQQQRAAATAGSRVMLLVIVNALRRRQHRATAGMARLPTTLAATATLRRHKPRPITGGRFGGIAGVAADPLLQPGQLRGQGGELEPQLIVLLPESLNLLLLSEDQRFDSVKGSAGPMFATSRHTL